MHIQPGGTPILHEGWDATLFLRELFTEEEYGSIVDIGCGYGRLCTAFNPLSYLGIDINEISLDRARQDNPRYDFEVMKSQRIYPYSETKVLFYVLLHQSDEDIEMIIANLCKTTVKVIVAEICGREWRREGNPPVFNRNVEEYILMFGECGKHSVEIFNKPYVPYLEKYEDKNTDVSIMVFE